MTLNISFADTSSNLQQILKNSHLREILTSIDRSSDPGQALQLAMNEPIFVEFADECLKVVEPLKDIPL